MSRRWSRGLRVTTIAGISATGVFAPSWAPTLATDASSGPADGGLSVSGSGTPTAVAYLDGTYTATGQYGNQPSFVTVTLTVVDGVIRTVQVQPHATDPTSLDLQRRFAAAVPKVVVGKRLDEVKVGKLAGSSGTPKGFNAAVEQIRRQAHPDSAAK